MIRRSWLRRMHAAGTGPGELVALERSSHAPHPHVIPLIDACVDADFLYLVFPFAEGGELFARVVSASHAEGMPEWEAAGCFAQVVAGLLHLKRLGLTHGCVAVVGGVLLWVVVCSGGAVQWGVGRSVDGLGRWLVPGWAGGRWV
jgi:hypothetical protein